MERQIDNVRTYLLAKGQPFEIISDIGSGINYKKKGLLELVEDLVQIITVFSCKLQGKRANKAKKLVQELIQEEETDGKSRKSNVNTKQRAEY